MSTDTTAWQPFATAPADGTVVLVAWIEEERCKHGVSYSWRCEPDLAKFWVNAGGSHWRTLTYSDPLEVDTYDADGRKLTYANPPTHWAPVPALPPDVLHGARPKDPTP